MRNLIILSNNVLLGTVTIGEIGLWVKEREGLTYEF